MTSRMCWFVRIMLGIVLALMSVAVWADAGLQLANTKVCLSCHRVDTTKRAVGPPFNKIGERYAGMAGAKEYLATTIRQGSKGKWGVIPMPVQTQVSEAEATVLASWILSLADDGSQDDKP